VAGIGGLALAGPPSSRKVLQARRLHGARPAPGARTPGAGRSRTRAGSTAMTPGKPRYCR